VAAVAEAGIAIEINTAGLFKDVQEMYPALEFLTLARSAGIPLTINSDAHAPHEVGRAFPEAVQLARAAGYSELVRFARRTRTVVKLP
jgi:histidinol-phosphatase (PHP family)